ncbi:unnamed protein product [Auanema sp. JU1783]|nr:unnamed protein product [Auanema sp. JU1783]
MLSDSYKRNQRATPKVLDPDCGPEVVKLSSVGNDVEFPSVRETGDVNVELSLDIDKRNVSSYCNSNPVPRNNVEYTVRSHSILSPGHLLKDSTSSTGPRGFSVSISARQPEQRSRSDLFSSNIRELPSDSSLLRPSTVRTLSSRQRRLSPHNWTTVYERTEISYVKRITSKSPSPTRPSYSNYAMTSSRTSTGRPSTQVATEEQNFTPEVINPHYSSPSSRRAYSHEPMRGYSTEKPSKRSMNRQVRQQSSSTCRWTTFDDTVNVHHPIYPPRQSPYVPMKSSPSSRRQPTNTFGKVREVAAIERTEWLQRSDYIPPSRRSDDIFTIGTPFVIGRQECDENGCEYLRYQASGLRETEFPMIEDGATECRRATVERQNETRANKHNKQKKQKQTNGNNLHQPNIISDEEMEQRRRTMRRARQRMRNYCTML